MGLILKWREIREKMRHYDGSAEDRGETESNLPSSPARDSRKPEDLPDLRCPGCRPRIQFLRSINSSSSAIHGSILGNVRYPYLKGDVIVADTDLKLLLSNDVLFRPVGVIFPFCGCDGDQVYGRRDSAVYVLCYFTRLHNPLELLHDQWSYPH